MFLMFLLRKVVDYPAVFFQSTPLKDKVLPFFSAVHSLVLFLYPHSPSLFFSLSLFTLPHSSFSPLDLSFLLYIFVISTMHHLGSKEGNAMCLNNYNMNWKIESHKRKAHRMQYVQRREQFPLAW